MPDNPAVLNWATVNVVPRPDDAVPLGQRARDANPNNLRPNFLRMVVARNFPATEAIGAFTENPYIEGTPQFVQYNELNRDRARADADRWLRLPEVPVMILPTKRRLGQPTFKLPFENLHDLRMRLAGGYLFVGSKLYYCSDARELEGDFLLILRDDQDRNYRCWYNKTQGIDLRTPEPQYVTEENVPGYFFRIPVKQQRQAVNHDNMYIKRVGTERIGHFHPLSLVKGLTRECVQWRPMLADLFKGYSLNSLRLSKDIAVYRDGDDKLIAEYRGRNLGEIRDDRILVDELDVSKIWIHRDAGAVGLQVRGK